MDNPVFSTRRTLVMSACAGLVLLTSGCGGKDNLAAIPTHAAAPVVAPSVANPAALTLDTAPRNTGSYPTFGKPLVVANTQMTNADAASLQAQLAPLGVARTNGSITEAEYQRRVEELRKLAAEHGAQTQAEIAK